MLHDSSYNRFHGDSVSYLFNKVNMAIKRNNFTCRSHEIGYGNYGENERVPKELARKRVWQDAMAVAT